MEVLRNLYRDQLTEAPKRASQIERTGYSKELGWIFVCQEFTQPRAIRTYRSLFGAKEKYTYFTPNTFYRNDQRHAGSLRWLNAMVIDIDVKTSQNAGMIFPDVMDRVTSAGLPTPSLVVQTPSGGFHVYWYMKEPRRAFPKVVDHYKRVQRMIAEEMNADLQAIGAERWFRLPTEENTIFRSGERVSFDDLCDWLTEQQENQSKKRNVALGSTDLLSHPAILKLLEGVEEGQRDNTCYTLALAYKAAGYEEDQALSSLYYWNEKNSPSLRQIEVKRKVKSAFKPGSPLGPSSYWIETLSGIEFKYQVWQGAKPREERTYSHLDEWKEDILSVLRENGGCICGAQREIVKLVQSSVNSNIILSYTTFKRAVDELISEKRITKVVEGKGRAAKTTLRIKAGKVFPFIPKKPFFIGANSYTFIDRVVGWSPALLWYLKYISLLRRSFVRIGLDNFRSFNHTGMLELKDINIFIGKNSSGKSSLLRVFPLMKQTFNNETSEPILWYTPDNVDFGDYTDVVGFKKNDPISFTYNFSLHKEDFLDSIILSTRRSWSFSTFDPDEYIAGEELLDLFLKVDTRKKYVSSIQLSLLDAKIELHINNHNELVFLAVNDLVIYKTDKEEEKPVRILATKQNLLPRLRVIKPRIIRKSRESDTKVLLSSIATASNPNLMDEYIIPLALNLLKDALSQNDVDNVSIDEEVLLNVLFGKLLEFDRDMLRRRLLSGELEVRTNGFISWKNYKDGKNSVVDDIIDLYIASFTETLLLSSDRFLKGYFSKVIYIAPLRASVNRYYRLQGIAISEMDASGANFPMIIMNMKPPELKDFQQWTKENFGFTIEPQSSFGHISVLMRFGTEEPRNIIDLGFGYSQLIPIILAIWSTLNKIRATYSKNNTPYTIVIEQPELHLHPAMQAEFIDMCSIISTNNKDSNQEIKFVIETHSEIMINRLSESIKKDKLKHESVTVNIVNIDDEGKSSVHSVGFDEDGDLLEWPIGFFSAEPIKYDYKS